MKVQNVIFLIFLLAFTACQIANRGITINGQIIGNIPEKVSYTSPINGTCNWLFNQSVYPDSTGHFGIKIKSDKPIFFKIGTSFKDNGLLIIEPGKKVRCCFRFDTG